MQGTQRIFGENYFLCLIIMAKKNILQNLLKPHYLLKDSSYSLIFVSFYSSVSLFKASLHILTTLTQVLPFPWCRIGPCQNYDGIPKVFLQPKSFLMETFMNVSF